MINMNELDYTSIEKVTVEFLPDEMDLIIRGIETYMFIFHNIYSQHDDSDEGWMRDFVAMNLYSKLMKEKNSNFKTNYDVMKNCENHANRQKKRFYDNRKNYYKKIA